MAIEKIFLGTTTGDKTGTGAKAAGQIINNNFDYLEAKIDNASYLIAETSFSLTDQNLTMNSGWEWLIVGVNYTNPAAVVINIPFAEIGKQRIDLIVMNQSNTFQRIAGTESISNPVAPPMPKDKLQATLIVVSDGAISEPLQPIVGSDYILKQESYDFLVSYYDAVIEQVDLNDHRASLNFMGTNTDVKSIALSGEFMRNGKIFTFKNHNATPLTIWHNSGTGNVKLLFPNEENFVLQPNEVIQFSLNYYDTSIPRLEYIGIISSGGGVGLPIAITDVTGLTEELADRYTKSEVDAKVSSVYKFKGNVANYEALPATGLTIGDVYNLLDTGANYAWTGTVWDKLGDTIDISGKEDSSNKSQDIETDKASTTKFGSVKALYDWCVARFQKLLLNIETTDAIVYTLDYTNSAKRTVFTSANPIAVTIPTNSVTPIPVGARRELTAQGDGVVTIGGAGITFTTNLSLSMVKGETRILTKIATDTWTVEGNLPVAGALVYNTYFINSSIGNNTTGRYEDSSKPFATIDYVVSLGIAENSIIYLQNIGGIFPINGTFPEKNLTIKSDLEVTIDFSANTNNYLLLDSNQRTFEINIPKGKIKNDRSGGVGVRFFGSRKYLIIIADEIYWNCSSIFIYSQMIYFQVRKISSSAPSLILVYSSTYKMQPIIISEFVCIGNNVSLSSSIIVPVTIFNISGTGYYNFASGNYNIGDISTSGQCVNEKGSGTITKINFLDSSITTATGIRLGKYAQSYTLISGNIKTSPKIETNQIDGGVFVFKNFSADFKAGVISLYGTNISVSIENCSLKSNGIILDVLNSMSGSISIKNSSVEMVTPSILCNGGAGGTWALKISALSTNATALSNQIGTGVTVTQTTNY